MSEEKKSIEQTDFINSLLVSNWIHVTTYFWVEAQRKINPKKSLNLILREYQDFMNWDEDTSHLATMKRNYFTFRNRFFRNRDDISQDNIIQVKNKNQ